MARRGMKDRRLQDLRLQDLRLQIQELFEMSRLKSEMSRLKSEMLQSAILPTRLES